MARPTDKVKNRRKIKGYLIINIKDIKHQALEECLPGLDFMLQAIRVDLIQSMKPYLKK